jgi:transcriptional repressor NrdR
MPSTLKGVNCPDCQAGTRVVETRSADAGTATRRRRECPSCGGRFTTYERREPVALVVRKRDGGRERFDPTKLRAALIRAAHKRPVRADQVERLVDRVEAAIGDAGGEMASREIGELCLAGLRELDAGAYLQFLGVFDPAISGSSDAAERPGSVRSPSEDAQLPAQAASRRGTDG